MIQTIDLRVDPRTASNDLMLRATASTQLGIDVNRICSLRITRRSIDARQRRVMVNVRLQLGIDEPDTTPTYVPIEYGDVSKGSTVIVVGMGPAGLFAALRLIELGFRPIVLERGKDVDRRRLDLAAMARKGQVDTDSNYCFGEGGAGAFSDGKLYTRSTKRGDVSRILGILCQHGASTDILVDAHPHIGSDRLPGVVSSMRRTIIASGGEVHFDSRVTDLIINGDTVEGVITADGTEYRGPVIMATGHSARDTYRMLHERGIAMSAKGIAIGVRLEHPQALIDSIQYHNPQGRGKYLPAAEYTMLTRVDGRAVYSFCMCPGGIIVPSASGPNQQAVNGMSASARGSRWANSGMVVEILPDDVTDYEGELRIMHLQEHIERRFYEASDGSQRTAAQRMTDFVAGRESTELNDTSYAPGIFAARLDRLLPEHISSRLRKGFEEFGRKYRGFLTPKATVIGCETRTSSPVRLDRDAATLVSLSHKSLYPAGEGAGYAGGIVSAAIDGERAADAIASALRGEA